MRYTIESDSLRVQVNLQGIELSSIQDKTTGQEYLWQGDPVFWTGQAPVLFPIIGALKDGKTSFEGKDYALPKHGFVRNSSLASLVQQDPNRLVFRIESSPKTVEVYPFEFVFEVSFLLAGKTLEISHKVVNTDSKIMYYSLGGHPAFNCPLLPGERLEEYLVEFTQKETDHTWMITPAGLIGEQGEMMLNESQELALHAHIFDQDALIFKNLRSRAVSIRHQSKGPILKMYFEDFDYLGIWAKPGASFVCLEPWLGIADSADHSGEFTEKEGIRRLAPGTTETKKFSIEILR
jgi:galactose mutarotase-like enzyme